MIKNHKFGRVGVLMGGISLEREVSLKSGEAVYKSLLNKKINAVKVDWCDKINIMQELLDAKPDVVFIALHGKGGEDGNIQAVLNTLNLPYTGSGVQASAMMMDKVTTKKLLKAHSIKTPNFIVMPEGYNQDEVLEKLHLPLIVKPIADGSSKGITIVHTKDELHHAWSVAHKCGSGVFAEEMVAGIEVSVSILGDRSLPSIKIVSSHEFYDYSSKYISHDSQYIIPAVDSPELESNIQRQCLAAYRLGGCRGWGRVDGILDKHGEIYIFDINTIPGLTETSLLPMAAQKIGIGFDDMIIEILASSRTD